MCMDLQRPWEDFDRKLPSMMELMCDEDLLIITADRQRSNHFEHRPLQRIRSLNGLQPQIQRVRITGHQIYVL